MIHSINGIELPNITVAQWDSMPLTTKLSAHGISAAYRRLVWQGQVMPGPQFDILRALEGSIVALVTQKYRDRNTSATYYNVVFENLQYQHDGPNMVDVRAEFKIYVGDAT